MTSEFIDTNVLIYAFSEDEPQKADLANELIFEGNRIISLQVINEFSNVCLRKFGKSPQTVSAAILEIAGSLKIVNTGRWMSLKMKMKNGSRSPDQQGCC